MSQTHDEEPRYSAAEYLGSRLTALVDGELGPGARERVLAHLATCAKCKTEADAQRHLKGISDVLPPNRIRARLGLLLASRIEVDVHLCYVGVTPGRQRHRREPRAERWASLAARIAGDRRDMRTAWLADLDGDPEGDAPLTVWQQRRYALGILGAAIRCRLRDGLGRLWRPVDWMLATRNRQETSIGVPPALLVVYIVERDGLHTLLTEGWGWVGGCGAAMFTLVRWLQRVRGIELAGRSPSTGE
ncbi:anti-sigma factor family protein [Streptomyces malaysiensis]|uniref:anti-sigma factor family protein n=1 Tax=Streptomyces malaysiensis TaxID=92644 RepID=UPI003F4CAEB7